VPLRSRAVERDVRKVAPAMRQAFADQAARDGARRAAMGPRWS
jgi:hypothetical protein